MGLVRFGCIGVVLLVLTPSPGSAQDRRVYLNLGGGPTFNAGDIGDRFGNGWGPAVGVTIEGPKQKLGFQFEYGYRWFDIKDDARIFGGATRFSANHKVHQLDFNAVWNVTQPGSSVRPYVVAGPGLYHRSVEITEYVGNGVICDPYWYVCGVYPVADVVGSRGGWDFGFNVGGGAGFGIGGSAEFYVEMRYHYVAGPDIQPNVPTPNNTGSGASANGSYYPLTFGFRF
jgi:hypothetical protein